MPIARLARTLLIASSVALATSAVLGVTSGPAGAVAGPSPVTETSPALFTMTGPPPVSTRRLSATASAPSWGGYIAQGTQFRYIQATFTVPSLNCHRTPGTSKQPDVVYDWVGLDGTVQPATVEQDGVGAECYKGKAYYGVWWETFPKNPVFSRTIAVYPGQSIRASVYYSSASRKYQLTLTDLSNGEGFSTWQRCGGSYCQNGTAEVITESPCKATACNSWVPMADFGTSSYWGISITSTGGQKGAFASSHWQNLKVIMIDGSGRVKAAVSNVSHGTAFKTYWENAT